MQRVLLPNYSTRKDLMKRNSRELTTPVKRALPTPIVSSEENYRSRPSLWSQRSQTEICHLVPVRGSAENLWFSQSQICSLPQMLQYKYLYDNGTQNIQISQSNVLQTVAVIKKYTHLLIYILLRTPTRKLILLDTLKSLNTVNTSDNDTVRILQLDPSRSHGAEQLWSGVDCTRQFLQGDGTPRRHTDHETVFPSHGWQTIARMQPRQHTSHDPRRCRLTCQTENQEVASKQPQGQGSHHHWWRELCDQRYCCYASYE